MHSYPLRTCLDTRALHIRREASIVFLPLAGIAKPLESVKSNYSFTLLLYMPIPEGVRGELKYDIQMKKIHLFFNILWVALLLTSCASTQYVPEITYTMNTYSESTGRNVEPATTAINLPLVAEVQVTPKKINYTETEAFKNIFVTDVLRAYGKDFKTVGIAEYKRIALAKAANANNADLIVGATFIVETTKDNHFSITVTGYPAVYKNFHTVTKADAELLKLVDPYMQKVYYDPVLNIQTAPIITNSSIIK